MNIYLLPETLRIDIDKMLTMKNDFTPREIMPIIKNRFKGKVKFSKTDLQEYINQRVAEITGKDKPNLEIPTNFNVGLVHGGKGKGQDTQLDNIESVDIRNNAAVIEYFQKRLMKRMKLIDEQQNEKIEPYLEVIAKEYTKEMMNIVEKKIKLQLEVENSNKLDILVMDRLLLIMPVILKILNKRCDKEILKDIIEDMKETFRIIGLDQLNMEEKSITHG
jgi:hypothetical protein